MKPQNTPQGEAVEVSPGAEDNAAPGQEWSALAAVAANADGINAPPVPGGEGEGGEGAPARPVDYLQDARETFEGGRALCIGYAPATAELLTDEAIERMARAWAPVAEKYGWSLGILPVEVTAAIVIGPVLYGVSKIVAAQMQAQRATKGKPAASAPGGKGAPGDAVHQAPGPEISPQVKLYPVL